MNESTALHYDQPKPEQKVREALFGLGRLDHDTHHIGKGEIIVDNAYVPVNEGPPRNISIYIGGLPHNPHQNASGFPQETGAVPNLLTNEADAVIVLKPEGTNNEAYREGNRTFGQQRVADASLATIYRLLFQHIPLTKLILLFLP